MTDEAELKAAYTELVKIYLTDVPSFTLMYRPQSFHAVNESVWTGFPHDGDGTTPPVPPLDAPEPERAAKSGDRAGVHSFGRDKACTEWSDGCVVCRRAGPEETACSTAGVACTPAEPPCRKPK